MSKEVRVIAWCDGDHPPDEPVPAVRERDLSVDGDLALVDVCEDCDLIVQAVQALMANGVPPSKQARKPGPGRPRKDSTAVPKSHLRAGNRTCPICQFESTSRPALGQHMHTRHGTTIRAAGA